MCFVRMSQGAFFPVENHRFAFDIFTCKIQAPMMDISMSYICVLIHIHMCVRSKTMSGAKFPRSHLILRLRLSYYHATCWTKNK